jgi:selenophosphate synthase
MSKKSNIALAILAGAAIGGIIALAIKAESAMNDEAENTENDETTSKFELIAKQFSDRIATDLKAAENKIKNVVKKGPSLNIPDDEYGIFL